jgi:hypothetical protein
MTARYFLKQLSSVWTGELFELGSNNNPNESSTSPRRQRNAEPSQDSPPVTAYYERAKHLFAFWKQKEKDETARVEKEAEQPRPQTPVKKNTVTPTQVQSTNRHSLTLR